MHQLYTCRIKNKIYDLSKQKPNMSILHGRLMFCLSGVPHSFDIHYSNLGFNPEKRPLWEYPLKHFLFPEKCDHRNTGKANIEYIGLYLENM